MSADEPLNAATMTLPTLAITLGDVAGIGPEVVVRSLFEPDVRRCCRPVVVGDRSVLARAGELVGRRLDAAPADDLRSLPAAGDIICCNPSKVETADIPPGRVDARAGRAAYEWLVAAARAALDGHVHGVVTAPVNKAALRAAGLDYPGHTEILAELCGVRRYAMMLYLPGGGDVPSPHGLGVAHATLHTSLRSVPDLLTVEGIVEKIELTAGFMKRIGCAAPRIGVCALNPHAGEEGLFGDEEQRIIAPAVEAAGRTGIDAAGPLPADTLMRRAAAGEFDGVVAMFHDQGHIALKLIGFERSVNVTLGLPIVRTSPSHGTGFDIAWQGRARAEGMIEAVRLAARLTRTEG